MKTEKVKTAGIVLSAGKGSRMQSQIAKQYMELHGKPIIWYSLNAFEQSEVDEIIMVVAEGEEEEWEKRCRETYGFRKVKKVVHGGAQRYHSVYEGLCAITSGCGYVLVHDGARPMITSEEINYLLEQTEKNQACVLAVPVKDTIKEINEKREVVFTPDRNRLWQIQTPQGFAYQKLKEGYEQLFDTKMEEGITDDSMVWEATQSEPVTIMEGSYCNIKITTAEDLLIAEQFLQQA